MSQNPKSNILQRHAVRGLLAVALVIANVAYAQQASDSSAVQVKTTKLATDFYVLEGAGGNISVLVAPDGVLLIDSGYAALTSQVTAALQKLTNKPVRFVVNTHVHPDHSGGNEGFATLGATVFARTEVRERLLHPNVSANGTPNNPAPALALPTVTYDTPISIHLNIEDVRLVPIRNAHTDGDTLVVFPIHDILATGDYYRGIGYPFADMKRGGSLQGLLAGLATTIGLAGPSTKIVPGHGPITDRGGLIEQRELILKVRDKVAALISQGKTLEQVLAAMPTAEFDKRIPGDPNAPAFVTNEEFVTWLYRELTRTPSPFKRVVAPARILISPFRFTMIQCTQLRV
jgi:cyclase